MKLVRSLLVTLCLGAGLVVFSAVPAVACSCTAADPAERVDQADVVFSGTLIEVEQTNPGGDAVISSGDPVFYTFAVTETFKGEAGDAVVESVRDGATCGLEGMRLDQDYVVFAAAPRDGALTSNLCSGTAPAADRLIGQVAAAVAPGGTTAPPISTSTQQPPSVVPTEVPSGVAQPVEPARGIPAWAWFGSGVLLAVAGGLILDRAGRVRR